MTDGVIRVKEYGYAFDAAPVEALLSETKGRFVTEPMWGAAALRSGRDALKAAAREYRPGTVLIPALSCESMVLPFRAFGHTVRFYRLKPDYSVDMDHVRGLIPGDGQPCLFLYMDYFGRKAVSDEDLLSLRGRNVVLIEDRTHNVTVPAESSVRPDYTVASLRKWLAVPDGGLLWGSLSNTDFSEDDSFSVEILRAEALRYKFFRNGREELKTEYRRIFSTASDRIDADPRPGRMTLYARKKMTEEAWELCRTKRRKNAKIITEIFRKAGIPMLQEEPGRSDLYVPILTEDRDGLQKRLAAIGIFTTLIWPLSEEQRSSCEVAADTEARMLGVPCDQRYSEEDVRYVAEKIAEYRNGT